MEKHILSYLITLFSDKYAWGYVYNKHKLVLSNAYTDILVNFPSKEWLQLGLDADDIANKLPEVLTLKSGLDGLAD